MPSQIIQRDDLSEGVKVNWYGIQIERGKSVGIPGDQWIKSWKVPQSMYQVREGPLDNPDDTYYGGSGYQIFPSTSLDPNIALQEYKDWENRNMMVQVENNQGEEAKPTKPSGRVKKKKPYGDLPTGGKLR